MKKFIFAFLILLIIVGCEENVNNQEKIKIAVIADVHLQDVYGDFTDSDFKGIFNPINGQNATIRTMAAQLHSTRIFNENYFAFLAALDDLVKKGIKIVLLPGDFSDDGQAINVRGLKEILDEYSTKHGLQFYLITGNHDPVRPFYRASGKKDYLGFNGQQQAIMSLPKMYNPGLFEHPVVISKDIGELGYKGIMKILGDYGFFPKEQDIYWETPFSSYTYSNYRFSQAEAESGFEHRQYLIPPTSFSVPDASYLVEPLPGLWLLAIDANVYIPVQNPDSNSKNPNNYTSANIGYNNVLTHKKHLISWVENISNRAKKLDKTLVVFSHYPMVDFHDDASANIQNLLGNGKMQTQRVPVEDVAQIFADAGIKLHFAGHLHVNDTGVRKTKNGNTIVNVQVPSLAAYIPAYKLLTIHDNNKMEVETIVIDSVPRFNEFFELYKKEHDFIQASGAKEIWNKEILTSENYFEFTEWHIKELVRLRFIPSDWSSEFGKYFRSLTGRDLLILSQIDKKILENISWENLSENDIHKSEFWEAAAKKAVKVVSEANLSITEFDNWNGEQFILDFYKLRNADELAFHDIGKKTMEQYQLVTKLLLNQNLMSKNENKLISKLNELSFILDKFLNGAPSNHFMVDLEKGNVETLLKETR